MPLTPKAGLALASLTLLGLAASSPAQAQTFYSNRTSFNAASSALTTLTFENLIGTPGYPQNYFAGTGYYNYNSTGITVGGVRFLGGNRSGSYSTYILGPDAGMGAYSLNGTTSLVGGRFSLMATLPGGVTSFGTDVGEFNYPPDGPITLQANIVLANNQAFTQSLNLTPGGKAFFGFTAASAISSITFTNLNDPPNDNGGAYAVYDNVSFGSSAPVPEASTTFSFGLLLTLGLGGVVIAAKRKKASAS